MSAKTLTVYSLPGCVQCNAAYRKLDKNAIPYEVESAAEGPNNDLIVGLGYMQAPVSVIRDADGNIVEHWGGFQPGKIDAFAASLAPVLAEAA